MDRTLKFKTEIEINYTEIPVLVTYHWANDGIGSYEYWGQKCFDAGIDYIEIDDIQPEYAEDTSPDNLRFITDNLDRLGESICERIIDANEGPDEPDEKD